MGVVMDLSTASSCSTTARRSPTARPDEVRASQAVIDAVPRREALMTATQRNLTIAFFVLLLAGALSPMVVGSAKFPQWLEVVLGGLMAGLLYSLVAIGLVLIFKASGVFNFAQGAMVLFAALTLVRLMEKMPFGRRLASTSRAWWRSRG
jgi:hypothetical protein